MMPIKAHLLTVLLVVLGLVPWSVSAQEVTSLVSLDVRAGFDGRFRENMWMPLQVRLENNGDPIEGRLVVRPERSNALTNTFSAFVSLPTGSRQTVPLYISMNTFGTSVTVELFDSADMLVTDVEVPVASLTPRDRLYAVISNATSSSLNFTHARSVDYVASQANWLPADVPDRAAALQPIDAMIFSDVDSGLLSLVQRAAVADWVTRGGHLIVTGGIGWEATASGLFDLLPLEPTDSVQISDIDGLAAFAGVSDVPSGGDYRSVSGVLREGAEVLAADSQDAPLLIRWRVGEGTVDYLTLDPAFEPLRGWGGLRSLWFNLLSTVDVQPPWIGGFVNMATATSAMGVLPGVTSLPEVLAMVLFLVAYIAVIGPLNYVILDRLNRKELAWFTIPLCIVGFTAGAWLTGFNLRGSEAVLSRLNLVQSHASDEEAQVDQLIGVLVPRRGVYSLGVDDARVLRPISSRVAGGGASTVNVDIVQSGTFEAAAFAVDASFVAGFTSSGTAEKPGLSGSLSAEYVADLLPSMRYRGAVRNDSGLTLEYPLVMVHGGLYRLESSLAPGEIRTVDFSVSLAEAVVPLSPSVLETASGFVTPASPTYYYRRFGQRYSATQTISDILNVGSLSDSRLWGIAQASDRETQELFRKRYFLEALLVDQFNAPSRGSGAYLLGWTTAPVAGDTFAGAPLTTVDTTLYVIELGLERAPSTGVETVFSDRFTWTTIDRQGFNASPPYQMALFSEGVLAYRFTPLPDSVLDQVEGLTLILEHADGTLTDTEISLWDWQQGRWRPVTIPEETTRIEVSEAQAFIGPQNSVQVQIARRTDAGQLLIDRIGVEQRGRFD
jgi:hypothetical protein